METVGYSAFNGCDKVTSVFLPATTKDITGMTINNNPYSQTITCMALTPPAQATGNLAYTCAMLRVPAGDGTLQLDVQTRGKSIYIIKMSDGTAKKVFVS